MRHEPDLPLASVEPTEVTPAVPALPPVLLSLPQRPASFESTSVPSATVEVPNERQAAPKPPSFDEIAREAYFLYVGRGCQDGYDLEDWLAAEESLRQRSRA